MSGANRDGAIRERPDGSLERVCRDCEAPFTITAGEVKFFANRQLQLPRRCAKCRQAKRLEREEAANVIRLW